MAAPVMGFRIRRLSDGAILDGIPTPLLISEGGGDAYEDMPGHWRLRVDPYDPAGTEYTKVRIEQTDDYRVDVEVQPVNEKEDPWEPYRDFFIVHAASEAEAFRLAEKAAHEEVERSYGDEYGSIVTVIRALKGVNI